MRNFSIGKYKRIRKDVARRLFNDGRIVYLTPSNIAACDSGWFKPCPISNRAGTDFDYIVKNFEFYNCNYELGYYTNFWTKEEEE